MTRPERLAAACDRLKALLLEKDAAYGGSALDPLRFFSRADAVEQLRVRIDDKLSRLARGDRSRSTEDERVDLIGYLILLGLAEEDARTPA
jgi:hypothetical protein